MSYKAKAVDEGRQIETTRPCSECRKDTLVATLVQYGARCHSCYEFYLRSAPKTETANKRRDGPKAWAWHLRAREQSGARLSIVQRGMWRASLERELVALEGDVIDVRAT